MSQYRYQQELDFNEARADLDSILENIVNKANAGESSPEVNKSIDEESDVLSSSNLEKNRTFSDIESPRRVTGKSSRKRKKKEDLKEEKHKPNSCVMRLFDRSVDLAQFSEETPLYPICRAWMSNDPYDKKSNCASKAEENEDILENKCRKLENMPRPDRPFHNFLPNGRYISPRIPSPVPQPPDHIEDYIQNPKNVPSADNLLINHLQHWKKVREKWIEKSVENEGRYETGINLLKEIANRQYFTSLPT